MRKIRHATERPNWDELFIAIAVLGSSRGTCDRLRTSCVLVKNNRIVGSGYNGAVAGLPNCDEDVHLMINEHCVRTLHGEDNAIANAVSGLEGATAYIIATPCLGCVKKMLQYGVKRIVYVGAYDNGPGSEFIAEICQQKGVKLEQWASDPKDVFAIFQKIFTRLKGDGGIFQNFPNIKLLLDSKLNIMKVMREGQLIIFEGGEKSGKSTQVERLAGYLIGKGYPILVTKEPGGGMLDFRKKILELDPSDLNLAEKELELFEKDREIHYREKILLALGAGKIVICDRGPMSTLAYQGYGRGVDLERIREANKQATKGREADFTILLDLLPSEYLKRVGKDHETEVTRFEKEKLDFHERVGKGFLMEAVKDPKKWVILPAGEDKDRLTIMIQKAVNEKLGL